MNKPLLVLTLFLFSCAAPSNPSKQTYDEGLVIMNRVNFESPPEAKVQTAKDLLVHAAQYDQLMSAASSPEMRTEAQGFLRSERATAATLMREAAGNYQAQNQVQRARELYRAVLTTFTREDEAAIRQSAESELNQLGETESKQR